MLIVHSHVQTAHFFSFYSWSNLALSTSHLSFYMLYQKKRLLSKATLIAFVPYVNIFHYLHLLS
uniref:Uncharacterized protein n=1 Tax=Anguilla anguilla TaxID=7936 RepID=A0A0E9QE11_ANGAN